MLQERCTMNQRCCCVLAHRQQTLSVHACWSRHAQPFRDRRQGTANSQQPRVSLVRTSAAAAAATNVVTLLPRLEYQPDASHPSGQPSSAAFGEPLAGSAVPLGATLLPEQVHGNYVDETKHHMLPALHVAQQTVVELTGHQLISSCPKRHHLRCRV
jgi:hypothetical protein